MSAVYTNPPLGDPMQYDPSFKVECYLQEPLRGSSITQNDLTLTVTSICSQIDVLCKRELAQQTSDRIDHGHVSSSFESKAMVLLSKLEKQMQRLPAPQPKLADYVKEKGISLLYPRAAVYIDHPKEMSLTNNTTDMDKYFSTLGHLHQVNTLAHQLNSDICNLSNHKYIAHQLALLYQSVGLLSHCPQFASFKKEIEEMFVEVKDSLVKTEAGCDPRLSVQHKQRLLDITSKIANTVVAFPAQLTQEFLQPSYIVGQFAT